MSRIAICVALYEAGRPFLADFLDAVQAAAREHDARLVAAVDGLRDAGAALAGLAGALPVSSVELPPGHTPAGVRRHMLAAGRASGADVLVFTDMDDRLAPDALDRHLEALQRADFSYGDLELIDADGGRLGRRFFDGANVPERVASVSAIRDRNFLGFSNTAVWTTRIPAGALAIPDGVVAADWWFFTTLVLCGCRGARTASPVAAYRLHDGNLLGAGGPRTAAQALRQADALMRHYQAFAAVPAFAGRLDATVRILARLREMPPAMLAALLATSGSPAGAWFEGFARLAEALTARPAPGALTQQP